MTDTAQQSAHGPILRKDIHARLRDAIIEHPKLAMDIEPRLHRTIAGNYSSHLLSRAGNLAEATLDMIFKDQPALEENSYRYRVHRLATNAEQKGELLSTYRRRMTVSPFKNGTYASELLDAVIGELNATIDTSKKTGESVAAEAAPIPETEPQHDIPLDKTVLEASMRNFFRSEKEMHWSSIKKYNLPESSVEIRVKKLAEVAMKEIAGPVNSIPAFKARLTRMEKPDSSLAQALTKYLNSHVGQFPTAIYTTNEGGRLVADAVAIDYAHRLCQHLKQWIVTDHITIAVANPKALKTAELAEKLGAADPGKSAA